MNYRPPYYKKFPLDYLSSPTTRKMTLAENGLFNKLLDYAWLEEPTATLPADLRILSKLTGVDRRILRKFTVKYPGLYCESPENPQRIYNPRQMAEYQEFLQTVENNRLAGLASAKARQSKATPVERPFNHKELELEVREEKKERKAGKPRPPADVRYGPFLELARASFEAKHGQPPTWDVFRRDGSAMAAFLRRAPHVTLADWQIHLANYFDSTELFTVKQGGSLSYFISKFDTFAHGPILERYVGGSNGNAKKLTGDALTAANLRAAGYSVQ